MRRKNNGKDGKKQIGCLELVKLEKDLWESYAGLTKQLLITFKDENRLRKAHYEWVEVELENGDFRRNNIWSEFVAVGNEPFLQDIQQKFTGKTPGRNILSQNGTTAFKEPQAPYSTLFDTQKDLLSKENTYCFPINS